MRVLSLAPCLLALACTADGALVPGPDREDGLGDTGSEVDPGPIETCHGSWMLAETTPVLGEGGAPNDTAIRAVFFDGLTASEAEHCVASFEVRLVVDTHEDPGVQDWAKVRATPLWKYRGDREWGLLVRNETALQAGATYAVEVDLQVPGERPLGTVWAWTMAD